MVHFHSNLATLALDVMFRLAGSWIGAYKLHMYTHKNLRRVFMYVCAGGKVGDT